MVGWKRSFRMISPSLTAGGGLPVTLCVGSHFAAPRLLLPARRAKKAAVAASQQSML